MDNTKARYKGEIMTGAEYKARFKDIPAYRWCHSDLINSGFRYRFGENVHPDEGNFDLPAVHTGHYMWFMLLGNVHRYSEHGTTLCSVEITDDSATVFGRYGTETESNRPVAFTASRFVLKEACAWCVLEREANILNYTDVVGSDLRVMMGIRTHIENCDGAKITIR